MSKLQQALQPTRELSAFEKFRAQVERLRTEIGALVGKDNVERFIRVCLNAVQANPDVLAPPARKSLLLACMKAAQDRLLPDGREAVFNVYKVKTELPGGKKEWLPHVQYLPMVGGMVKKLYDSGHATFVDAVAVRELDYFKYQRGDEPRIEHEPYVGEDDPGKVIAAYVIVKLKNGETKREVMTRREIEQVRMKSKSPDGLMWGEKDEHGNPSGFYDQAAIKSVIKRAYKQLPSSYELETVIASDNATSGLAAETGADRAYAAASSDLEALIDGRLDQELRTVPTGKPAAEPERAEQSGGAGGQVVDGVVVKGGKPAGTDEIKGKLIAKLLAATDSEIATLIMDEANLHEWTPADLEGINREYLAAQARLSGGA